MGCRLALRRQTAGSGSNSLLPKTVETQPEAPLAHVLGPGTTSRPSATSTMAGPWFEKLPPGAGLKGSTNSFNVRGISISTSIPNFQTAGACLGEKLVSSGLLPMNSASKWTSFC